MKNLLAWLLLFACFPVCAEPITIEPVAAARREAPAPLDIGGRAAPESGGIHAYQWPGVYFETAFDGTAVDFVVGPGAVVLHLRVDGAEVATLQKPTPGTYRVAGMTEGTHVLRLETATESQAGPNRFGGFFLPQGSQALTLPVRARRIEFIGDSHTVGYGNRSPKRECSDDEVWSAATAARPAIPCRRPGRSCCSTTRYATRIAPGSRRWW